MMTSTFYKSRCIMCRCVGATGDSYIWRSIAANTENFVQDNLILFTSNVTSTNYRTIAELLLPGTYLPLRQNNAVEVFCVVVLSTLSSLTTVVRIGNFDRLNSL